MSQLPHTLYHAAAVRELDRQAIEIHAMPGIELMNRAGAALFDELIVRWPDARRLAVVCGGGNNGGDGFVVARLALEQGLEPKLICVTDPATLKGDARKAWGAAQAAGLVPVPFKPSVFDDADVIVDAIFGIGLDRPIEAAVANVIHAINNSGIPVLAVDIPSGLSADSGVVMGCAVHAEATVTFIGLKQGLFTGAGSELCGAIRFEDLGVPLAVYDEVTPSATRIDWAQQKSCLPPRPRNAHKGMFGHVLVIGGNHGMAGAVRMAAEAAARTGAGLTSVATRREHVAAMAAARPEIMWHGVEAASDLTPLLARATVIAIGPGLGQDAWAQQLLARVLESSLPLVVDADALNLLAHEPCSRNNWILTPHPGEAARLLQSSSSEINADRFGAVQKLREHYQAVVVLKGAGTLIADEQGAIALCSEGNPGMAVGGMGDVLTGVIVALVAQGLALSDAARVGVSLHAAAGDRVALEGERGLLAGDLFLYLRRLVNG
ncbi:MAG: NAD(P)H-hydrate dehydratase [Gammaproteobacteria bacterium]|nr:NAD(P)H-hydrate dehydratase [Gammaproteobacteria bacterium]